MQKNDNSAYINELILDYGQAQFNCGQYSGYNRFIYDKLNEVREITYNRLLEAIERLY